MIPPLVALLFTMIIGISLNQSKDYSILIWLKHLEPHLSPWLVS